MEYLNLLCNITFKREHIQIESPHFVSIVKYSFGKEYHENEQGFTYGTWEIFLDPFRSFAKEIGKEVHQPDHIWFNNVHRLYRYHILPGLQKLMEEQEFNKPNRYRRPHTYCFALPYFVNDEDKLEIPAEPVMSNNFSHTPYRKEVKFSEVSLKEKEKRDRWDRACGQRIA